MLVQTYLFSGDSFNLFQACGADLEPIPQAWSQLTCSVMPVLSFQAGGTGCLKPALRCWMYYSRLVVLVVTYLLCGAGSIIPGLW